mmetsp:Transcript_29768/g.94816  ORF Transcript_29768/g.94816 Transcript_29768/m.94816 type:complete len:91 (-) Transcript_29768:708-980(-)
MGRAEDAGGLEAGAAQLERRWCPQASTPSYPQLQNSQATLRRTERTLTSLLKDRMRIQAKTQQWNTKSRSDAFTNLNTTYSSKALNTLAS